MKFAPAILVLVLAGCATTQPAPDQGEIVFTDEMSDPSIWYWFGKRIDEGCAVSPDAAGC